MKIKFILVAMLISYISAFASDSEPEPMPPKRNVTIHQQNNNQSEHQLSCCELITNAIYGQHLFQKRKERTRSIADQTEAAEQSTGNKEFTCKRCMTHCPLYSCVAFGYPFRVCKSDDPNGCCGDTGCSTVTGTCGVCIESLCWPCSPDNLCREKCCPADMK